MKVEEKLFGRVESSRRHEVRLEEIMKEFEKRDSVMFLFCTGCGALYELNDDDLEKIKKDSDIEIPGKIEKRMYLKSKNCENCSDKKEGIELGQIDMN